MTKQKKLLPAWLVLLALTFLVLLPPLMALSHPPTREDFVPNPQTSSDEEPPYNERFGMNNINYVVGPEARHGPDVIPWTTLLNENEATERRQRAREIGATWTRWVLWWHLINEEANGCDANRAGDPYYQDQCQLRRTPEGDYYEVKFTKTFTNSDGYPQTYQYYCPPDDYLLSDDIESWTWSYPENWYDELVSDQQFEALIVLQGVPRCLQMDPFAPSPTPENLEEPIFQYIDSNGQLTVTEVLPSDVLSDSVSINPENYWARFVYEAVKRYGDKVQYWQIWNEVNDESHYWPDPPNLPNNLSCEDREKARQKAYARLVEVTYWAIEHWQQKHGNGQDIQLLLSGLADTRSLPDKPEEECDNNISHKFETKELVQYLIDNESDHQGHKCDGQTCTYIDYLDIYAWHKYIGPWGTFEWTSWLQEEVELGNSKDVWITESGLNTNLKLDQDKYPGLSETEPAHQEAINSVIADPTSNQQEAYASYVIQHTAYMLAEKEEYNYNIPKFFQFQLDNSAHNTGVFGLTEPDYEVNEATLRPAYDAYRLLYEYLKLAEPTKRSATVDDEVKFIYDEPTPAEGRQPKAISEPYQAVYFKNDEDPEAYDRVTVLWSVDDEKTPPNEYGLVIARVKAEYPGHTALLVWQDDDPDVEPQRVPLECHNTTMPQFREGENWAVYEIRLPNQIHDDIGGKTLLLLEDEEKLPLCDADDDGIPDLNELIGCPDRPPLTIDDIIDGAEPCDVDNDTRADYLDTDSDNDGVADIIEAGQYPTAVILNPESGVEAYRDASYKHFLYKAADRGNACQTSEYWNLDGAAGRWQWSYGFETGVECGIQMIRSALAGSGIELPEDDPPVADMLFGTPGFPVRVGNAQTTISATATHATAPLNATFTTEHTLIDGDLSTTFATNAWVGAQFESLTVNQADVYDENDQLIASGAVSAQPVGKRGFALALGDVITATVSGTGSSSFYGPATGGLGVAGDWADYSGQVQSDGTYGIGLSDALVTVAGQVYSGTLVLVTEQSVAFEGAGRTFSPNFAPQVVIDANGVGLQSDEATLVAGDAPFGMEQGFALPNYSGAITIRALTDGLDEVTLDGTSARDLALSVTPQTSTITPEEQAEFDVGILSNEDDTYTVTVSPPVGWQAEILKGGHVSVVPVRGAKPDDYAVTVWTESAETSPLLATAVHTVTLVPHQGMGLAVAVDPLTTVPWGLADGNVRPSEINNGQAQLSSAYIATISNTSTVSHTFTIDVVPDNFPSEWLMLGGVGRATTTELTLPAGGSGELGVYIAPLDLDSLPAAGTEYPFTVLASAVSQPTLTQSAGETFIMPARPFARLTSDPLRIYSSPGYSTTFEVRLENVGNTAGTFPLEPRFPIPSWRTDLSPVFVAQGSTYTGEVDLYTPAGEVGQEYLMEVATYSEPYTLTTQVMVQMVSEQAICAYQLARAGEDDVPLSSAAAHLGSVISRFEKDFDNMTRRDELLRAIETLKQQLESYPELSEGLERLRGTTDEFDDLLGRNILLRLPILCRDLFIIVEYLELLQQYRVTTRITPGAAVTLPGRPITYTLEVKNEGTVPTTYLTSLSAPDLLEGQVFTPTLEPGELFEVPFAVTASETGFYPLSAQVEALSAPLPVQANANASLKVVDAATRVMEVKANPAFVETGHSETSMSAYLANIANWRMSGIGTTEVLAPDGTSVYSGTQVVTIALNEAQNSFDLGQLDTSGFAAGIYTITFKVDIFNPAPLSGLSAQGSGLFSVGQGIQASVKVEPEVVLPGNPVVTTTISTEQTTFGADGASSIVGGTPSLTQTIEVVAPTNASKNNPQVGVPLQLSAGTYDVMITDGAVRKSASGAWYDTVRVSVYYTTPLAAEYWLGYGVDAANGGSATPYEALAQNRNKFVRIYLAQEADLYLWIPDDSPTDSSGSITLTVRRMYKASTHISRRIEGALGLAIPRQEAETAAFDNWVSDNGCTACHVQSQALVGFSDVNRKLPTDLSQQQMIQALIDYARGSTHPNGRVGNEHDGYPTTQTSLGFWSLASAADQVAEVSIPDLRPVGIKRYEDNHPDVQYNGRRYNANFTIDWTRLAVTSASTGYVAQSERSPNTVSLDFNGRWVSVGFMGTTNTGKAQILVDGQTVATIDTYRRTLQSLSQSFELPDDGPHTIEIKVLDQRGSFSSGDRIYFDYFDVWDGTPLPEGSFSQDDNRVPSSTDWQLIENQSASGGSYYGQGKNIWFPFTGESMMFLGA